MIKSPLFIALVFMALIVAGGAGAAPEHTNTNHLINSFSPYLRQHAHNPVNWYPWGVEALDKARREDKPILLSIGYSTCYWCHVLEREVFTQQDAAGVMNENFINIKVDREVRPDLDEIYMSATQLMTGSGGWPNNLILTPDLKPFSAVTYLPKDRWMAMTRGVAGAWKNQRKQIEAQADQMEATLKQTLAGTPPIQASLPASNLAQNVYETKAMSYDRRYGGFGAGTKFPQETGLLFLLDHAKRTNAPQALSMVQNTVDHMLSGGIHDHVGGGFHRYSTEAQWRLPPFEKLLYNQALMSVVLANLYEDTGEARYKRALTRLLDYVARDMSDKGGAFYSAQDAETDAVEGAYYVWDREELKLILDQEDYDLLTSFYDLEDLPHFPGHTPPSGKVLYRSKNVPDETTQEQLDSFLTKLLQMRKKRNDPLRDDKILAAWNGMMIYGLAEAGRVLEDDAYIHSAEKAADFILKNMKQDNGKLYRIYRKGQAHQNAFFEDYAWLSRGLMALHRVSGKDKYKVEAIKLIETADRYFWNKSAGGYFMTDGSDGMFVRIKQGDDGGALPSGNPVMAHVFVDLYATTKNQKWNNKMADMVSAFAQGITDEPYRYGHMIYAMNRMDGTNETWLDKLPESTDMPRAMESKDKVKLQAHIVQNNTTPEHKSVKLILDIDEGWHLNANPASLEALIPTAVDIQSDQKSTLEIQYPSGQTIKTPLGTLDIYEGRVEIEAIIQSDEPINASKMHALVQLQACKEDICYPPSQITLPIQEE